jgi:hypothetical protein
MKIIAKKVKARHLMPGDLFSLCDQEMLEWLQDQEMEDGSLPVGMKVYVRTNAPCPEKDRDTEIYRIRIERK